MALGVGVVQSHVAVEVSRGREDFMTEATVVFIEALPVVVHVSLEKVVRRKGPLALGACELIGESVKAWQP